MPLGAQADVRVFAAASLAESLTQLAQDFEAETGTPVSLTFAGSAVLARQILAGAPADVFVSANVAWMEALVEAEAIAPASRVMLLSNALVLIAPAPAAPLDVQALPEALGSGRLAMALVDAVPAGIYGRAALDALGLWESLAPRVAQADNVRAALALVAVRAAPFGIVYATDALADPRVAVVAEFPEAVTGPILYPAARIAGAEDAGFLAYLQDARARDVFEAAGFTVPEVRP